MAVDSRQDTPQLDQYGFPVERGASHPPARMGAGIVMFGAVMHALAVFITWYTGPTGELRGLDTFIDPNRDPFEAPGRVWLVAGGVLFALGLFTFIRGRIFGVAVATTLVALVALLTSLLGVGAAKNMVDVFGGSVGKGTYLGIASIIIVIGGCIRVLIQRAR